MATRPWIARDQHDGIGGQIAVGIGTEPDVGDTAVEGEAAKVNPVNAAICPANGACFWFTATVPNTVALSETRNGALSASEDEATQVAHTSYVPAGAASRHCA